MDRIVLRIERRVKVSLRRLKRQTPDKGTALRCQIVLLSAKGRTRKHVAEAVGCDLSWVRRVLNRFVELGVAGLFDRREDNGGRKIDERYLSILHDVVDASPQDYGYPRPTWTRELLTRVMEKRTGVRVHVTTMSRALEQIGARPGRPRPVVRCTWPDARKNRRLGYIRGVLKTLKPDEAFVYMDEADIHLNPKIGLDWMNRGTQKEVVTPGKNVKRYICGTLDAVTAKLTWVIADRKNSLLAIAFFKRLLRAYPDKRVIHVVLDNYSIHHSRLTQAWLAERGGRLRLHFLPPYCPEGNKIERLWLDMHANVTRNHRCGTIDELVDNLIAYLIRRKAQIRIQCRPAA
jgi:transposase